MHRIAIGIILLAFSSAAWPLDACSTRSIVTRADVAVSDGKNFKTESFFQAADAAAIRHIDEASQIVAVEGPLGWMSRGDDAEAGQAFYKTFALGHQYHALLLHFDELIEDVQANSGIPVAGGTRSGLTGKFPYSGVAHLVHGDNESEVWGLVFEYPETPPIVTTFHDWRPVGDETLPFHARIDDGNAVFDYRYTDIEIYPQPPRWFARAVGSPPIDELEVYRLYRRYLTAHCAGDSALITELLAPEVLVVDEGKFRRLSAAEVQQDFDRSVERVRYASLRSEASPVIEISAEEGTGTIWASARASAAGGESEGAPARELAWVLSVRRIDGVWKIGGIATSRAGRTY